VTSVTGVVDDLAFFDGDAVVRPVTATLGAPTALLRRLESAAGPDLAAQLRLTEPLAIGSAIVSGGGRLSAGFLVHAVVASDEEPVSASSVRRALLSALERAEGWAFGDVAVPPFGLGAGNLNIEESAQVMAEALAQHARRGARHPERVTLIAENDEEADAFRWALGRSGLA
jgi:O-acetyl-ADP-ribose deacetylase (regulator of RNase III)